MNREITKKQSETIDEAIDIIQRSQAHNKDHASKLFDKTPSNAEICRTIRILVAAMSLIVFLILKYGV